MNVHSNRYYLLIDALSSPPPDYHILHTGYYLSFHKIRDVPYFLAQPSLIAFLEENEE